MSRPLSLIGLTWIMFTPYAVAQPGPGPFEARLETDPLCDPDLGRVRLGLDAFGSTGSAVSIFGGEADFDPADDLPDQGYVSTMFESMPFLCRTFASGASDGSWLESGDQRNVVPETHVEGNDVSSSFAVLGLEVSAHFSLNCTVLEQCYTFTNVSGQVIDLVALTPYIDGDLYFRGGLTNDFGATSMGSPKTLWEFDEGDDAEEASTFVGMYGLDRQDTQLNSWEVGQYPEQRSRIASMAGGCTVLDNDVNMGHGQNIDRNNDLITDRGFDVTLALRYDIGPLEPGETGAPICYAVQWGVGLPCSDEDLDEICLPQDNCPRVPNPDQLDEDRDGVGDVCDNCPKVPNGEQMDSDEDGVGDSCDRVLCTPDGGFEVCDGLDNDCDGFTDLLPDGGQVVVPGACATGLSGPCGLGHWECVYGQTRCVPETTPSEEICDLLDNDCDGEIDENVRNACGSCGPIPQETCNGHDDNCDGNIDEEHRCEAGRGCYGGQCLPSCDAEGHCPDGSDTFCTDGVCVPWCFIHACEPDQLCTEAGCVNPCDGVNCGEGEACVMGECRPDNCIGAGCPEGERCSPDGCVPDPCAGLDCGPNSFCREGECVFSCAGVTCPLAMVCVDGLCAESGCAPVGCPGESEICVENVCVEDPCKDVECGPAEACILGNCVADPCLGIACPHHQRCDIVLGEAQCVADWPINPPGDDVGVSHEDADAADVGGEADEGTHDTEVPRDRDGGADGSADAGSVGGGGGDGCAVSFTRNTTGFGVIGLVFLLLVRRRRRR